MNIKDSLISISLLTVSIFVGMLGIVGIIRSFQALFSYGFSYGALIDEGPGVLFGILLLLLARFLYRKAHKIREKAEETYKYMKKLPAIIISLICALLFVSLAFSAVQFTRVKELTTQIEDLQQQIDKAKAGQESGKNNISSAKKLQERNITSLQKLIDERGGSFFNPFLVNILEAVRNQDIGKIEKLEEKIKSSTSLSKEQLEASLNLLDHYKNSIKANKILFEYGNKIYKVSEIYEKALKKEILEKEQALEVLALSPLSILGTILKAINPLYGFISE